MRRVGVVAVGVATVAGGLLALQHMDGAVVLDAVRRSSPPWVAVGLGSMCLSLVARSGAWRAMLRAASPDQDVGRGSVLRATSIGVLLSAVLPGRIGEPARALVVARRLDDSPTRALPLVLGTLVAQTVLNVMALVCLAAATATSIDLVEEHPRALIGVVAAPLALLIVAGLSGVVLRSAWLIRLRAGLAVLRTPRLAAQALALQGGAWAIQVLACFAVLRALGLDASTGLVGAAAVLFAVNVTAVVPITPSNVGVFQAACVAVLAGGYGVDRADALAYGVCLQAVSSSRRS